MRIDAVLSPPEIDLLPQRDLQATTCVVFDVLRATSSMLTALAGGVTEICPVTTIDEARELKRRMPDALLGGERHGDRIDGFDLGNSPLEHQSLGPRRIITTTTNGTVALRACAAAQRVFVGALLNIDALTARLLENPPGTLLLVCAGTFRELALEDVFAAGMLCARFPGAERGDAAAAAVSVFREHAANPEACLRASRNGRELLSKNRADDVAWAARCGCLPVVAEMTGGVIRRI